MKKKKQDETSKPVIDPRAFVKKSLSISSGQRIAEVLKRYWKHVGYYKKEVKQEPLVEEAKRIFKTENGEV
jgi:hypothetical protein